MVEFGYQVLADADVAVYHHKLDIHEVMNTIAQHEEAQKSDEAFLVINLSYLYDRYQEWKKKLPRIQPYYAIKSNSDPVMTKFLADMGCGFDCASKKEMNEAVLEGMVEPDRVIYANPVKHRNYIKHAERIGIRKMTFDNEEELLKVKQYHRNPEMVLRIRVDDPTAGNVLGIKFGCDPPIEKGTELLKKAKEIGVPVVGIAFHVGTMCNDPKAYREGLSDARKLFDIGTELGHELRIVDIGGGFPGQELPGKITFDEMIDVIEPALKEFFPEKQYPNLEITAEPGRFFSTEPVFVVVHVIGVTKVPASRITKKGILNT
ncbi:pyridoxal-dependent decarboxylase, pyridoxal binding domain-containing protein [Ditylenchus destructor]|uniref:ornithine decarboxylase n=1 Tax=Ditylenchus destructor TaxID=166010 RepID=A0AAD4NEM8_9BILA|nr:pyridoxal-dependent decarboxylase, pyridoxal binding domain-containing protein [Ditylenchus destructor]